MLDQGATFKAVLAGLVRFQLGDDQRHCVAVICLGVLIRHEGVDAGVHLLTLLFLIFLELMVHQA